MYLLPHTITFWLAHAVPVSVHWWQAVSGGPVSWKVWDTLFVYWFILLGHHLWFFELYFHRSYWTNYCNLSNTTLPGRLTLILVLLVTVTGKIVASPSFTVVRDSSTVSPNDHCPTSSGSNKTGVLRWISLVLALHCMRTVCPEVTTCDFSVVLTRQSASDPVNCNYHWDDHIFI